MEIIDLGYDLEGHWQPI